MLPIKLNNPNIPNMSSYGKAISYLASNTIAFCSNQELRPHGQNTPSFDMSQVGCWLSEQSLRNWMHLCTIDDGNDNIKCVEEESIAPDDPLQAIAVTMSGSILLKSLLLLSADTYAGLKKSLEYFHNPQSKGHATQQLIKDPDNEQNYVTNPAHAGHYIFPNQKIYWVKGSQSSTGSLTININDNPNQDQLPQENTEYLSCDCFVYEKDDVIVQEVVDKEVAEGEPVAIEILSEKVEHLTVVKPNPRLPLPLFIRAQNTIRLFRLNGNFYQHEGLPIHLIQYNISKNEHVAEDQRIPGRLEAYKVAKESAYQSGTMEELHAGNDMISTLDRQHRTLVELSGYRSVWAAVYNKGAYYSALSRLMQLEIVIPDEDKMEIEPTIDEMRKGTRFVHNEKETAQVALEAISDDEEDTLPLAPLDNNERQQLFDSFNILVKMDDKVQADVYKSDITDPIFEQVAKKRKLSDVRIEDFRFNFKSVIRVSIT